MEYILFYMSRETKTIGRSYQSTYGGEDRMVKLKLWWRAVRPFSFTVSVIPPILGAIIAFSENPGLRLHWLNFFLTLVGCVAAHAGSNLLSDYFDFKKRVDREGTFGSSGILVEKTMQPIDILLGACILLLVAGLIGLYLTLTIPAGVFLLGLIFVGAIFGVFYTAGPIAFKYHGLGDIAVFISFGSAMVLGAYYVQAHRFSWSPVLYALPIALLVDAILHSNNLRDIRNDKIVDIKTFAMLIGENAAKIMYSLLIFGSYFLIVVLICVAKLPVLTLVTFLTLPLAIKLVRTVRDKDKIPVEQFVQIDAATAQFHSAFSVLMIVSLLVHHFILV
jgi:1,4-dihydroxy-2-naphthoate octaprenyltransferase